MLRPLNTALPSGMSRLPNEVLVEIVRYAVTADEILPIDIDELIRARIQLTSPFYSLKKLTEVAEDEIMRMNTFSMDLDYVPSLHPVTDGIQHLQVHLELLLAGGRFVGVDDFFRADWNKDSSKLFPGLKYVFPRLKTLNVQVRNYGEDRVSRDGRASAGGGSRTSEPEVIEYADAFVLHSPTCIHFHGYKKMEHMLQMQKVLMAVGAVRTPKLARKTVTFNQSCDRQFRTPPPVIGDNGFGSAGVMPFVAPRDNPLAAQKARAGLLFCELRRYPKSLIEEGAKQPRIVEHFSRGELEKVYASDIGKKDREYLKRILTLPVVVVQMPFDR